MDFIYIPRKYSGNRIEMKCVHDGQKNTYPFIMGKIEAILPPSKEEKAPKSLQEEGDNFLAVKVCESEESGVMYMLITKVNLQPVDLPSDLEPFLEEFRDVMSNELPIGFPSLRDIQHHFDLIPGSMLSNKA